MEYKFAFFIELLANVVLCWTFYLGIKIVFERFHYINGWSFYEVMFLYSMNLITASISGMFVWAPMTRLSTEVHLGNFDAILIKPMNPLLHLIFRQFQHTFIGWIGIAIAIFINCVLHLDIAWNFFKIFWLIVVFISGILINSSFLILTGSVSFWFVKNVEVVGLFNNQESSSFRTAIDFPISIYNKFFQLFFTFIVPYAFINFYPATYFLNKSDNLLFHPVLQFCTPVVGILVFGIAYLIWSIGINQYSSTGS